jgi:dolichol-phosphate mannosyltransferase
VSVRRLVVLPTYQEAENIPEMLPRIAAAAPPGTDVLVVDDASPDGTADRAEELGAYVLRRTGKRGLGPAYADGFAWGLDRGYQVFAGMDADLSHDPAVLPTLFGLVEDGADMAVGSRYVDGGAIPDWPAHRRALSRWGNRYATRVLRLPVRDATSGYRAFSAGILRRVDAGSLRAGGYGFLIELVYRVARAGGRIAETPIVFRDRERGESKMDSRIVAEAMALVTLWGIRDRLVRRAPWLLAAATFLACIGFRPEYPTDWDSVNLMLGVDRFDVTHHSPHPPGYWLYVFLGRVVRFLTPLDAEASLAVLSAAAAGAAVGLTYVVGHRWAGPWLGWAAAGFVMTSPFLLFFGAIPSTYAFDALIAVLLVLLAARAQPGSPHAWIAAGVLGLGGGLRQTSLLVFGPIVLVAVAASVRSLRAAGAVAIAGAAGVAAWLVPMLLEQPGGWTRYRAFSDKFLTDTLLRTSVLRGAARSDVVNNLGQATGYTVGAVLVLLPVATLGAGLYLLARRRGQEPTPRYALLLWLCVLASLAFVIVVHFGKAGYVLSYLPASALLLLRPAARVRPRPRLVLTALVALACLVDLQRFVSAAGILPGGILDQESAWFTQQRHGAPYRVTRPLMRETDRATRAYLTLAREFDPARDALVYVLGNGGHRFRHAGWTLPQFTLHLVQPGVRWNHQRDRVMWFTEDRVVPVPVGGRAVFVLDVPVPETLQLEAEGRVTPHRLRTGPIVWVARPGTTMFGVTVTESA